MLGARLLACAAMIRPGAHVCDVGTDHAKLPVYLLEQGTAEAAIAADIGEGPLQSARRTIEAHGLEGSIRTILSDGLVNVPREGLTDIIIAGMGGETIVHILETCPWPLEGIRLVLQPMTRADVLRRWLAEQGFSTEAERCVRDGRFLYAVMSVRKDGTPHVPGAGEVWFGRMDLSDTDGRAYCERWYDILVKKAKCIRDTGAPDEAVEADVAALARLLKEDET